jgi:prophage DNA circulation protein
MAWRDQLRPASFRGVPFFVDNASGTAGRRIVLHEYPKRDKPLSEDMGRASREFTLECFVVGPDYMQARDQLLDALEKAGPGELVHPWRGSLHVVARPATFRESKDEGGMCTFSIPFVEAGELVYPSSRPLSGWSVKSASSGSRLAALDRFLRIFGTSGRAGFVGDSAASQLVSRLQSLSGLSRYAPGGWSGQLSQLSSLASDLVKSPDRLGSSITPIFTGFSGAQSVQGLSQVGSDWVVDDPIYATPDRLAEAANARALDQFLQVNALCGACDAAVNTSWLSYDDAVSARDSLAKSIEFQEVQASDDVLFRQLVNLRSETVTGITRSAASSPRLVEITPKSVVPALVLAYDMYEDPLAREVQIVGRNKIAHPGFVPVETLSVLSA